MMARFYADAAPGQDADYDVAIAVLPRADGSVPDAVGEARGEWLPLHHVLEAVHRGPHDQMDDAWAAVREACARPGLHAGGSGHRGLRGDAGGRRAARAVRHPGAAALRPLTRLVLPGAARPVS